jgi:hypothetical protein
VLGALPEVTVRAIADLVGKPVPEDAYTQVKRRLLATHALTEFQRLEKLLQLQQLGAQRPSELLADMLQLCPAGESSTKLFRMLFLQRMPRELRIILAEDAVSELQQLAARADVLWTHHGGAGGGLVMAAVSPTEEPGEDASTVAAVGGNPPRGKTWKWRGKPGRARGGRQVSSQDGGGSTPPDGGKQRVWLCSQHGERGSVVYPTMRLARKLVGPARLNAVAAGRLAHMWDQLLAGVSWWTLGPALVFSPSLHPRRRQALHSQVPPVRPSLAGARNLSPSSSAARYFSGLS